MKRLRVTKSHSRHRHIDSDTCAPRLSPTNRLRESQLITAMELRTDLLSRDRQVNRRLLSDTRDVSYLKDCRKPEFFVTCPVLPTSLDEIKKLQMSTDNFGILQSANPQGRLQSVSCKKMHSVDFALHNLMGFPALTGDSSERMPLGTPAGRHGVESLREWYSQVRRLHEVPTQENSKAVIDLCAKELVRQVSVQCIERGRLLRQLLEDLEQFYMEKGKRLVINTKESEKSLVKQTEEVKQRLEKQLTSIKIKYKLADADKIKYKARKNSYKAKFRELSNQQEIVKEEYQVMKSKLQKASMNFQGSIAPTTIKVSSYHSQSCDISPAVPLNLASPRSFSRFGTGISGDSSCQTDKVPTCSAQTQIGQGLKFPLPQKCLSLRPSFSRASGLCSVIAALASPPIADLAIVNANDCGISQTARLLEIPENKQEDSNNEECEEVTSFEVLDKDLLEIKMINDVLTRALLQLQLKKTSLKKALLTQASDSETLQNLLELEHTLREFSHETIDEGTQTGPNTKRTVRFEEPSLQNPSEVQEFSLCSDISEESNEEKDELGSKRKHHLTQRASDHTKERSRGVTVFKEFQFTSKDAAAKRKQNSGARKYYQLIKKPGLKKKANMGRKMVAKTIATIYNASIAKPKCNKDEFLDLIYDEFVQKYGLTTMCDRKFVEFIATIHTNPDTLRIQTFLSLLGDPRFPKYSMQLGLALWKYMHQCKTGIAPPIDETTDKLFFPYTRSLECLREKLEPVLLRSEYLILLNQVEQSVIADPRKQNALGLIDMDQFMRLVLKVYCAYETNIEEGVKAIVTIVGQSTDLGVSTVLKSDLECFIKHLHPSKLSVFEEWTECEEVSVEVLVGKALEWNCFGLNELKASCADVRYSEASVRRVLESQQIQGELRQKIERLPQIAKEGDTFVASLAWKVYSGDLSDSK